MTRVSGHFSRLPCFVGTQDDNFVSIKDNLLAKKLRTTRVAMKMEAGGLAELIGGSTKRTEADALREGDLISDLRFGQGALLSQFHSTNYLGLTIYFSIFTYENIVGACSLDIAVHAVKVSRPKSKALIARNYGLFLVDVKVCL
jgi:hypothetical protein